MGTKRSQLFCIASSLLLSASLFSAAMAQDSSCLNQLAPCLNYLNGTRDPPDSCCDPLKRVIESDSACLCSLVSNKGTRQAEQAGIDVNEAQTLPGRCGQHVNPLSCLTKASGANNSSQNSATKFMNLSQGFVMFLALSITVHILWAST